MPALETTWLLIVHAAATLFMTGLIWFVQIVHYPLMSRVGSDALRTLRGGPHAAHRLGRRAADAGRRSDRDLDRFENPCGAGGLAGMVGLALLGLIWLSTAALQVPQHRLLALRFEPSAHRRLVATNWIRVAAWSARSALVLYWIAG